jgi:hypothetical protein
MFPDSLPVYTPQKLYFNTISRRTLRWIVRLMPLFGKDPQKFGRNGDINLRAIAEIDYRIDAKIDFSQVSMQRAGASRCYASQGGRQSNRGVAGLLRGWANRYEIFMRGYPEFPPEVIERDLFEGVSSDI